MKLYRYTSRGEGIFSAGKRLLPEAFIDEALVARAWLLKPVLPPGEYRFYLTERGKERYEATLLLVHKKYLEDIACEVVEESALGEVVYRDADQVVIKNNPVSV